MEGEMADYICHVTSRNDVVHQIETALDIDNFVGFVKHVLEDDQYPIERVFSDEENMSHGSDSFCCTERLSSIERNHAACSSVDKGCKSRLYNLASVQEERKWLEDILVQDTESEDSSAPLTNEDLKEMLRMHVRRASAKEKFSLCPEKYQDEFAFFGSSLVLEHDKYFERQKKRVKDRKHKLQDYEGKRGSRKMHNNVRKRRILEEKRRTALLQQERDFNHRRRKLWNVIAKKEVPKAARARNNRRGTMLQLLKKISYQCHREQRREALRSQKIAKEAAPRARRMSREMLLYWRKFDKVEKEHRKKAEKEALEQRRQDEEMREMKRQQRKLNFLITQTELYAHFMSKKMKGTAMEDSIQSNILKKLDDQHLPTSMHRSVHGGFCNGDDDYDADAMKTKALMNARNAVILQQQRAASFDFVSEKKSAMMQSFDGSFSLANPVMNKEFDNPQPRIFEGKLKSYQLKGMNWLANLYEQGINGILADEMGLGKTVQSIAFLAYLAEAHDIWGPFLIVAPASTLHNWQQEVSRFVSEFKVLPYWGNPGDRKSLRKFWNQKGININTKENAPFHVLITSYQLIVQDVKYFQRIKWQYVILDEAQAIKSSSSVRWKILLGYNCRNRLLLTGTPIQNSMAELWALLHFIMPTLFDSHEEFNEWFSKDIENHAAEKKSVINQNQLSRLHMILKPFMLRRVKKDVENELSEKIEIKVICEMSSRQRLFYQAVKNKIRYEDLVLSSSSTASGVSQSTSMLMNLVMQFRKVCNHPELFERKHPKTPLFFKIDPLILPKFIYRHGLLKELPVSQVRLFEEKLQIWRPDHIRESLNSHGSCFSFSRFINLSPHELFQCFKSLVFRLLYALVVLDQAKLVYHSHMWQTFKSKERSLMQARDFLVWPLKPVSHEARCSSPILNDLLFVRNSTAAPIACHTTCYLRPVRTSRLTEYPCLYDPDDRSGVTAVQECVAVPYPKFLIGHALKVCCPPVDVVCSDRSAAYASKRIHMCTSDLADVLLRGRDTLTLSERNALLCPPPCQGLEGCQPPQGWSLVQVPDRGTLISDSGKLAALDLLLSRLKSEGHRVLVYSQMTKMIDILEEFMRFRDHSYMRLDGSSKISDRRDMVQNFQTRGDIFAFLLSTRAGGLGINLTAADTVIFYDSDWNPTVDQQAMDRAHRLGQTRQVTVYRLVTRGSIEEKILRRAKEKSEIQNIVISGGHFKPEALRPKEVVSLLLDDEEMEAKLKQRQEDKRLAELMGKRPGRKRKVPDPNIPPPEATPPVKKRRGRPPRKRENDVVSVVSDTSTAGCEPVDENSVSSQDFASSTCNGDTPNSGASMFSIPVAADGLAVISNRRGRGRGRGNPSSRGGRPRGSLASRGRGLKAKCGALARAAAAAAAAAGSAAAYAAYGLTFQASKALDT